MFWSSKRPLPRHSPFKKVTSRSESDSHPREVLIFREREVHVRRQPYRRSIGLTLQVNGSMRLTVPKMATAQAIESFLLKHVDWIENNLQRYQVLREAYPPKRYVEGEKFLFLGENLTLHFLPGAGKKIHFEVQGLFLVCLIPAAQWAEFDVHRPHPEIIRHLHEFYAKQGSEVIGRRLDLYAERMHLWPSSVSFRSQKTRWGSCSSRGKISLNWRLIIASLDVIDYVVVHELSHLRHYNHSQSFWSLVESQIPRYTELRQWLREHQYEADFLAKKSELHAGS